MQQLIQLLVGGLVVFVAAIWSLPGLRRMKASRRQEAIERKARERTLELGRQATSRAISRDLAGELDGAAGIVDLRASSDLVMAAGPGRPEVEAPVELELSKTDKPAMPEFGVELPPRPPSGGPIDITSVFGSSAPADLDLIEEELAHPLEVVDEADIADDEVVDAVLLVDDSVEVAVKDRDTEDQAIEDQAADRTLRGDLRAILPARQRGAALAVIGHLEIDDRLLAELLGPGEARPHPLPELTDASPQVHQDLHDVWGNHGSDLDVLVRALQALSEPE
ncbi:MAG: hypothetical protein GY929_21990 [Actinomycetia bacterium]|nr:hypothetical protein [Actinomycetes bacterium]